MLTRHDDEPLVWRWLGRIPYDDARALQRGTREAVAAGHEPPTLLLLEHPPTVTLGRRGTPADIRISEAALRARGVALVQTDRGGLATYHGPGQLVGYPIVDIGARGLGVHDYVRRLADALALVLAAHDVPTLWREDRPGLWSTADRDAKLVAFGVHVHRGVTTHGFALNVTTSLAGFDLIIPCGHADSRGASIASLGGRVEPLPQLASAVAHAIGERLGLAVEQAEAGAEQRTPPESEISSE